MDDLLASEVEEADDLLASLLEEKAVGVPKTWPTLFLLSLSPEFMLVTEPVRAALVTDNEEGVVCPGRNNRLRTSCLNMA